MYSKKYFLFYLLFGSLPILAYSYPQYFTNWHKNREFFEFLKNFPYFTFFLLSFIGLRLNLYRAFFISSLFGLAYWALLRPFYTNFHPLSLSDIALVKIYMIAIPIAVTLPFLIELKKVFSGRFLGTCLLCLLPLATLACMAKFVPNFFFYLENFGVNLTPAMAKTPLTAFLGLIILLYLFLFGNTRKSWIFHWAVLASLIPFHLCMEIALSSAITKKLLLSNYIISFSMIAIILAHSIYRFYWDKIYLDELTGIPNRRALVEHLDQINKNYILAMTDIDHFKSFNDNYGHDEGDNCLRLVSAIILEKSKGRAFRYGGEEFTIVLTDFGLHDMHHFFNEIREGVANRPFYVRQKNKKGNNRIGKLIYRLLINRKVESDQQKLQVTISIGVAASFNRNITTELVLKEADQALYQAKKNGRNCVMYASPGVDGTAFIA